jgi:hypothetical protein
MATVWQRLSANFVATPFDNRAIGAKRMEPTTGLEPVTCAVRLGSRPREQFIEVFHNKVLLRVLGCRRGAEGAQSLLLSCV